MDEKKEKKKNSWKMREKKWRERGNHRTVCVANSIKALADKTLREGV